MDWWIVIIICALPAYFFWCLLHEAAHLLCAEIRVGIKEVIYFRVWPSKIAGKWTWGYTGYRLSFLPSAGDTSMIAFAPQIPQAIGITAFVLVTLFMGEGTFYKFASVVLFGAVVDTFVWNLGFSKLSDLHQTYSTRRNRVISRVVNYSILVGAAVLFIVRNFLGGI